MPWSTVKYSDGTTFRQHLCTMNTVPDEYAEQEDRFDDGYGSAIDSIFWEPGGPHRRKPDKSDQLPCAYITNGEYASVVSYCPWCGERLNKPEDIDSEADKNSEAEADGSPDSGDTPADT